MALLAIEKAETKIVVSPRLLTLGIPIASIKSPASNSSISANFSCSCCSVNCSCIFPLSSIISTKAILPWERIDCILPSSTIAVAFCICVSKLPTSSASGIDRRTSDGYGGLPATIRASRFWSRIVRISSSLSSAIE